MVARVGAGQCGAEPRGSAGPAGGDLERSWEAASNEAAPWRFNHFSPSRTAGIRCGIHCDPRALKSALAAHPSVLAVAGISTCNFWNGSIWKTSPWQQLHSMQRVLHPAAPRRSLPPEGPLCKAPKPSPPDLPAGGAAPAALQELAITAPEEWSHDRRWRRIRSKVLILSHLLTYSATGGAANTASIQAILWDVWA